MREARNPGDRRPDAPARLAVGVVDYLNARPLVFGLTAGLGAERLRLVHAVPAELARLMRAAALDLALLPVIELARQPDLELVPGLAIGTRGDAGSVLLVSRCPLERLRTVALDPESRTSNVLTQVLLARRFERRVEYVEGERDLAATLERADAAVRIGDKALFEPVPADCAVHDLGREWTDWTGLPFVFAAWIARPGVVDAEVYRLLHESRRRGTRNIERIAQDYPWNGTAHPAISRRYLQHCIFHRFGSAELAALGRFFRLAAELGLIEAAPAIRLAFGGGAACRPAIARGPSEVHHG